MPEGFGSRRGNVRLLAGCAALVLIATAVAAAADPAPERLDPLQQAVVDSLAFPRRTETADLLDAAIRAADVDAGGVALDYFREVVAALDAAGDERLDRLADLGDSFDGAALDRLERCLVPRDARVGPAIAAIRTAARLRRRDPKRLAAAAEALANDSPAVRREALQQLAQAREDALPTLVNLLQAPGSDQARELARGLIRHLGPDARQPLLAWLGADDIGHWPGIIEALDASDADDIETFLLAPALVPDTPPAAREAAIRALRRRALARQDRFEPGQVPPSPDEAIARLAKRLDRTLAPDGLPEVDHLLLEPVTDPTKAAAALGGSLTGTVERFTWDPQAARLTRLNLPPRAARVQDAMHLARDLMALNPEDPAAIRLALLARLEATLVFAGDPATALDRIDPRALKDAVSPPEGFSGETAAEILDLAVTHGMWEAAVAAAAALAPDDASATQADQPPLPPAARKALVRALAVPDAALQFAAARALALTAGEPPYPGSSRVVEVLLHAATSTGVDRVIVAHPELAVAQSLATGVSRFGYQPTVVSTGREAVFAARESADTVLVLLAARTGQPSSLETVQFLQQQGLGGAPPVLIVVDPLDDDGRGCFLQKLLLSLCDLSGIAIVDRLDSFFEPALDPKTGEPIASPRFPDALAQAAGPGAVDPAARGTRAAARLDRAREAIVLLTRLGRRGWDVTGGLRTARTAAHHSALQQPALLLLATMGRAEAQQALHREAERTDIPAETRKIALSAFESSVARFGILLDSGEMLVAYARYNQAADADARGSAAAILDVIEAPSRKRRTSPVDAPPFWPTR